MLPECHYCEGINYLNTSTAHRTGKHGPLTYDINSRAVLGTLHIGIGETHVNNFLTTMNIPPLNNVTFKKREKEIGNAVECIASTSCIENLQKEKENAQSNNTTADSNGLIGFPVSYDMCWQKRGKRHNSLTGQGTAMGLKTGKVLAYATRSKLRRTCSYASREGKQVKQQDCRKNHNGSSKAMEPSVACELGNGASKQHARFSTYVGDDDTTTLSHLTENVPHDVEKWSDIVHAKQSLTMRLYSLSYRCKYQNSSVLSQKAINYSAKCFSYCIAQNSDPESLKKALKCVIPRAFGNQQQCSDSW